MLECWTRPVAVAALLFLGTPTLAEEGDIFTVKGEVVAVDAVARSLTVKSAEPGQTEETRMLVDDQTKIIKSGGTIDLSQLQPGDVVVANYRTEGSTSVAVSIGVQEKSP